MKKPTMEGQPPQSPAAPGPSESEMPEQSQSIAGVIGVVRGEVSPEEKAQARQMLNALQQVRDRSPPLTGPKTDSRAQEHSDAASHNVNWKRVKLDDVLAPALAEVGYKKVAKLTYLGEWSTKEVEHVLTLETYGVPKIYLYGDAGLRNPQASAFADQCRDRYADPGLLRCLRETGYVYPPWFCPTQFPIGLLLGGKLPWSLDMSACSPNEVARTLAESVRSKLVPFVSPVVSAAAFLEFLERNQEPVLWVRTSGCAQAAIVAYLAAALGVDRATTKTRLLQNARSIVGCLDETRLTPESYIEHILDDAEVAVAQTAT
jgi:hypothetical protein